MPNINLTTESGESQELARKAGVNWSLAGVAIIFVLTVAVWAVLFFYNRILDERVQKKQVEYDTIHKDISTGEQAKTVLDFKNRLELVGDLEKKNRAVTGDFSLFERAMVNSGVSIDSYKYNAAQDTVHLVLVSDNYANFAQQVLAIKQSAYFSGVEAGKSQYSDSKEKFTMELNLKIK